MFYTYPGNAPRSKGTKCIQCLKLLQDDYYREDSCRCILCENLIYNYNHTTNLDSKARIAWIFKSQIAKGGVVDGYKTM